MLGSHPLPPVTNFVVYNRPIFISLALLFPLVVILFVFVGDNVRSFYVSGFILLAILVEIIIQWQALMAPFAAIVQGMQGQG